MPTVHYNFSIDVFTTSRYVIAHIKDNRLIDHLGGATFSTSVVSERRLFECPFIDHENGTYDVFCEFHDECYNVSVTLTFIDFGAYRWNGLSINKILWQGEACRKTKQIPLRSPYTGWHRCGKQCSWEWMYQNKIEKFYNNETVRQCQSNNFTSIDFIGDSHMQYFINYWLYKNHPNYTQIGNKDVREAFNKNVFKISYEGTSYVLDSNKIPFNASIEWVTLPARARHAEVVGYRYFLPTAEKWWKAKLATLSNNNVLNVNTWVLVAGFGAWDAAFRNISQFVYYSIPALRTFFDAITTNAKLLANTRIVIYNVPAVTRNEIYDLSMHPLTRKELRNNALIAAINSLIADVVRKRPNIKLIDFYAMTLPRKNEAVDGQHYINVEVVKNERQIFISEPGITAANHLLSNICMNI